MASLSTLTKPISGTSFFLPKLSDLEFSRSKIRPLTRSNVFKNSKLSSEVYFELPNTNVAIWWGQKDNVMFHFFLAQSSAILAAKLNSEEMQQEATVFRKVIERMRTRRESHKTKQLYLAIYLYELDQHLDRFLRSATMAKIQIPFDSESIRRILIRTVSVSQCRKGSLRYWLSAGPGDFQLSPSSCHRAALYAIVIQDQSPPDHSGIRVVTSSIPIKPPQFAVMKSVNYLPNTLSKMEAEENDAYAAIWLDGDGFVAEGPNMNVAFVTKEKELLMPCFDKILSGCTAKRVLVLAAKLVKEGKLRGIRVDNVSVDDGKRADEMMLIGSGVLVRSVVQWDEEIICNGREGPVTQALLNLLLEDMKSGPPTVRVPIPY
ncbi:hypothetical protein RND71_025551 [Anisodus tanguticus]|uniref:Uncharacterized protein n=1 Tax=Anisodus tanguticus TaxID=243964 RepID=A0AAE1RRZ4_9SOLA|nr:hypothetical protein RND71_025551 [Anisodus tanguticus]